MKFWLEIVYATFRLGDVINKCSIIGNFQNMENVGKKHVILKGFWEAVVRSLGGGVQGEDGGDSPEP